MSGNALFKLDPSEDGVELLQDDERLLVEQPAIIAVSASLHNAIIDSLLFRLIKERKKNLAIEAFNARVATTPAGEA